MDRRMGKYSIKELEILSGIKAHTIRMWEKRYGVITPDRTDTNIRRYCDSDLKKLLNIALLNNNGHKISKICRLNDSALCQEVERIALSKTAYDVYIDRMVVSMVDLDRVKFEKVFDEAIKTMGFEKTCINVLYPLLQKTGVLWMSNSICVAREHFLSNLIKQKLYVAIDGLQAPEQAKYKAVLFLPEGELHEMGLLFYQYLLKKRGVETFYLGQSVPFDDLKKVVQSYKPDYLVSSFVATISDDSLNAYLQHLCKTLPSTKVIVSGYQISQYTGPVPKQVIKADDVHEFIAYLDRQLV